MYNKRREVGDESKSTGKTGDEMSPSNGTTLNAMETVSKLFLGMIFPPNSLAYYTGPKISCLDVLYRN